MNRPRKTGVNTVIRRRADGTVRRTDYYHRRTGLLLGNDLEVALAKATKMDGEAPRPAARPVTVFSGLVADYLSSSHFLDLSPRTRELNRLYVGKLVRIFGDTPTAAITHEVVDALRERLKREIAEAEKAPRPVRKSYLRKGETGPMSRGVATHVMNKLTLLMTHARRRGVLKGGANPASRPGGFAQESREQVWAREEMNRLLDAAPGGIRIAMAMLLYTAQRPSDVLAMEWSRIETRRDGRVWLWLTQQKTETLVDIQAHRSLERRLLEVPEDERVGLVLTSPTGLPWQYRNFARAWDRARCRADYRLARELFGQGLTKEQVRPRLISNQGLQRRDLRRTAMVEMARAGATDIQIAAVSGHTIEQTRRILDRYIPRRGDVAAAAITAWEENEDRRKVVLQKPVAELRDFATDRSRVGRKLLKGLARPGGFEPPTHSLEGCCSIQLS